MAAGMEELFRAHWPLVYGYLRRRTGDPALAEELAQETFYRATRAFLGWRGGSAAAWLRAIGRNSLEGRVHALVVDPASGADIERFLDDPAVRSVRIADVEFALYEPADS